MSVSGAVRQRTVIVVTPDTDLRERIRLRLLGMRWTVLTAGGGAEAMVCLGDAPPEAMIIDHWLPDLDAGEFTEYAAALCPGTDLLQTDGSASRFGTRSSRRNELLHALREAQDAEVAPGSSAAAESSPSRARSLPATPADNIAVSRPTPAGADEARVVNFPLVQTHEAGQAQRMAEQPGAASPAELPDSRMHLPDVVGDSPAMVELGRMVRMVAPHMASVLILGETGTGKELVAKAVHRLSLRASKPFVVLNCAAIPEHLLEAELFGHTRGAFTGAVTSRVGRIEAAHGGTLFLDEIGEMPLPLQAKMLRFLESGEIQRVGDNDTSRVDVRIVAATHQPLEAHAGDKLFRLDLYHRLNVFPVEVPPLRDRRNDIPMLVEFLLRKAGENAPRKAIDCAALAVLKDAPWGGNVRELQHVMQRAIIMAGDAPILTCEHLHLRRTIRS